MVNDASESGLFVSEFLVESFVDAVHLVQGVRLSLVSLHFCAERFG